MQILKSKFKRYRWLVLLVAGVVGLFCNGGDEALDELPRGSNLVSAIVALYAMWRNERDQVADQVVERIWHKLGQVVTTVETCQKDVSELRAVSSDHAGHLDRHQDRIKIFWPDFETKPVLRPAAR